jgi:uncharacterized protein YdiU (UPF0061 family)
MTALSSITHLDDLHFDNRFVGELPADTESANYPRQVDKACYSRVLPTPVVKPELVAYSREVAALLELNNAVCESDDFAQVFAGNRLCSGMDPYAMCYGGHQFGNWAGQLGDGRAINLGEIVNRQGQRWALQLKGAGLTPYSRSADGLAVLRSSIREFLCSEAMNHLGVPTTRALSVIATGEQVIRDMFYDGNRKLEPGAVVCRVAPSFIRFGNFQILTARGDVELLKKLVDYTICTDFPHLGEPSPSTYLAWFEEVCRRTVQMIVHWQRVGFVHGVMNTDNMSILGLTIDYGPYGWLENYDPDWTPNTTDAGERRYRFGNQPQIAFWNLSQMAKAIYPLIGKAKLLQQVMDNSGQIFEQEWQAMMAHKLGLTQFEAGTDESLIEELLSLLPIVETDMTIFYRRLALIEMNVELNDELLIKPLQPAFYVPEQLTTAYKTRLGNWLRSYIKRIQSDNLSDDLRRQRMNANNPKYVLRNYLAQLAIDQAEQGDYALVNELLELLRHPYDEQADKEKFAEKRPDWARQRAGCSMLSCSS